MDGIYIIPFYNVPNYFYYKGLRFFISRVEIFLITIRKEPFGVNTADMIGSN